MCLIFLWDFVYYVFGMGVYQKNKKWYYEFQMFGVRKHGSCRGCKDISSALEYEADIKEELSLIKRGKISEAEVITIKQMFDEFWEYTTANNKKSTYNSQRKHIEFLKELWGAKNTINTITPETIEKLKTQLKEKNLSNSTYNRYYSTLAKAFNVLILNHKLNIQNPCIFVKKLKEDNQMLRYLTEEEEKALMQQLPKHLKPIVICALTTGLRKSNILNLRWENINFEMDFIEILKQDNKGHKSIKIPLSKKFKQVLSNMGIKETGYIFESTNPNKKGLPFCNIDEGFNEACKRANIKNLRFHDLRHTVGTRLVANGADLQTVKQYLAHSSITTTQRYLHPVSDNMKKAVDILDGF